MHSVEASLKQDVHDIYRYVPVLIYHRAYLKYQQLKKSAEYLCDNYQSLVGHNQKDKPSATKTLLLVKCMCMSFISSISDFSDDLLS